MRAATVYEISSQVVVPMGDRVVMRQLCKLDRLQAVAENHGFTCQVVDHHRPVFRFSNSATGEGELLAIGPKLAYKLREMIELEVAKEERERRVAAEMDREEIKAKLARANDWKSRRVLVRLWHALTLGDLDARS